MGASDRIRHTELVDLWEERRAARMHLMAVLCPLKAASLRAGRTPQLRPTMEESVVVEWAQEEQEPPEDQEE